MNAANSARAMGRKVSAETIAKITETKKRKGIFFVPPHLRKFNNKLAAHGYRGEERRKIILEVSKQ